MHSQPTVEAPGSPVAAIPDRSRAVEPTVSEAPVAAAPGQRRPARRSVLAWGLSALRGDKYMAGAYPAGDPRSTTAPDEG